MRLTTDAPEGPLRRLKPANSLMRPHSIPPALEKFRTETLSTF
jgi:hypothetical protein